MIDRGIARTMLKQLPATLGATFLLLAAPSLLVLALDGAVVSLPAVWAMLAAGGLSLFLGYCAARAWERRRGSDDRLFADLMLWAWARRWFAERRVSRGLAALGLDQSLEGASSEPDPEKRVKLLCKLASDLEARNPFVRGHARRVARYASLIASRLRLPSEDVERIATAAALHDIGKLHTPQSILQKPGPLTDEEFAVVKRHAAVGARIIQVLVEDAQLASIVRHHHERIDGSGYPGGLVGEEIPIGARIIAVADTFDAITADRPYRSARPHRAALEILRAESGTQLDPEVVHAFQRVYRGERPLGPLGALTAGAGRLVSTLVSGVSGINLPAAGIAAATALGGGLAGTGHVHAPRAVIASQPRGAIARGFNVDHRSQLAPRDLRGGRRAASTGSRGVAPHGAPHATGRPIPAPGATPGVPQGSSAAGAPSGPASTTSVSVPSTGTGGAVSVSTNSGSPAPSASIQLNAGQVANVSATANLVDHSGQPASAGLSATPGAALRAARP